MGRDRGPSLRIESLSKAQPEISYLRTVISRFGGTIKEGTSVAIPPQTWDQGIVYGKDSFRSREVARPVCEVRAAGVPGYMGHVPHGRDSKRSPEGLSISTSTAAAQRFHATDYRALNRSRMPQRKLRAGPWERHAARALPCILHSLCLTLCLTILSTLSHLCAMHLLAGMPIVGYRGHLGGTKGSSECYGVSHWRPVTPPNRAAAAALAYEHARAKAYNAFGIGQGADIASLDQAQYEA